ncbi:MAG: adenosylcobinamide-phosphate synthase CbiB [Planctomycetota bacterium]|jgi:adenosylcobinamide-phosphate synthase|nr:adenosylcobinamide-phosphate synthase CbiB [Planctomycetota bacterium]
MPIAVLVIAFVLDLLLGDPPWMPHPVVFIGRMISLLEKILRRLFPASPEGEERAGRLLVIIVCVASFCSVGIFLYVLARIDALFAFAGACVLGWQSLAAASLANAALKVYKPLKRGDIAAAREAVGHIVGRETAGLDAEGVSRAAVETVAENTSDGVVAPLFYMAIGGVPLAILYKAINTMDSMIGYTNDKYLFFGRAAARLDDAANFLPARLTALLIIPAAWLCNLDWRNAWRICRRDRRKHASPNAGYPESACAGALGISLGGASVYFGKTVEKPVLGDRTRAVEPDDIPKAVGLLRKTAWLALALSVAIRSWL